MYALRTLSGDDETRRRIGVAGGIQAVVQCMVDCKGSEPQHAMLQEMAMWCLWNVAGHQGNRVRLSQSNCISACIEAMKVHPFSPGVQEQACWLLVCVCFDGVHCQQSQSFSLSPCMYIYYSVHSQQSPFTAALCSRSTCALACENFRQDVHAKQPRALVN